MTRYLRILAMNSLLLLTSYIGLLPLCACPGKKRGVSAWWAEIPQQRDSCTSGKEKPSHAALQVNHVQARWTWKQVCQNTAGQKWYVCGRGCRS